MNFKSIFRGISKVDSIEINLIADLVRDYGPKHELKTLHELNEVKNFNIIGIGIGGTEPDYPPENFSDLYEQARSWGFNTTIHAGEACGPESIWAALNCLRPNRIGHATQARKDLKLIKFLSSKKIPVELCVLSNVKTGVISSIHEHPIDVFRSNCIPFSINTDDPKMFGNSLADEYRAIQSSFNYSDEEIIEIIIESIETTWLDMKKKRELANSFRIEIKKNILES